MASKAVSSVPSEIASTASSVIATASAGAWLKKAVLRAAGFEGLAQNVPNEQGEPFGIDAVNIVEDFTAREETRYKDELQWVNCLDTSGQVFAILLNCMYLAPLTWLFLQFFITSYLKHVERRRSSTASETAVAARKSFQDASRSVARRLSEAVEEMHRTAEDIGDDTVIVDGDKIKQELKEAIEQARTTIKQGSEKTRQAANPERVKQEVQRDMERVRKNLQDTADKAKTTVAGTRSQEQKEKVQAKAQAVKDAAAEVVEKAMENVKFAAETGKEEAAHATSEDTKTQVKPTVSSAPEKASELKDRAVESGQRAAKAVKRAVSESIESAKETVEETRDEVEQSKAEPKEGKSPNGNGTGADEATGRQESASTTKIETGEPDEVKQEKKEEDKIIDESQAIRGEDVDVKPKGNGEDGEERSSEVRQGTSFAEALKE